MHDSIGQLLTAIKMTADRLVSRHPEIPDLGMLSSDLMDAINETRTLSHLLYPPLLDELGLVSAIAWFTEGYSQRTGVAVRFDGPSKIPAQSKDSELTLFWVLQESLTNVHRHAKSKNAEVRLSQSGNQITLQIRDFGVGIPAEKLEAFQSTGSGMGIGLAGMQDRVREQGGKLEIASTPSGTTVTATLPANPAQSSTSPQEQKTIQTA
jgi:signal transduction histidine kinase